MTKRRIKPQSGVLSFLGMVVAGLFLTVLSFGQFGNLNVLRYGSVYIHDVVLVFLVAVTLFYFFREKKHPQMQLFVPLIVFVGVGVLSLVAGVYRFSLFPLISSSFYLWRFVLYAFLYWIVMQPLISQAFWKWGLYITGLGLGVLGLLQYVFFPSLRPLMYLGWDEHYGRLFSTLLDPNFAGIFLILTLLFGMHLYSSEKQKIVLGVSQILLAIAIVLTFSRSSFVALCAALVTWAMLTKKATILLVIIACGAIYAFVPKISLDVNRLNRVISSEARITNWEQSIERFVQAPIIGVGFNTLPIIAGQEKSIDGNGIPSRDIGGVNSSLLFVLITTGIIGGAAYAWLLAKEVQLIWMSPYKVAGISAMVAILIHSLFNNSLFYAWIMIWWWIFLGLAEGVKRK